MCPVIAELSMGFFTSFKESLLSPDNNQIYWLILGGVIILIPLFFWLKSKCSTDIIIVKNTNGKVKVSRKAIKQLIYRATSGINGIGKIETTINTQRAVLNLRVKINLLSGHKLGDIYDDLQKLIEESLKEHLGFKKIGSIEILVKKVIDTAELSNDPNKTIE